MLMNVTAAKVGHGMCAALMPTGGSSLLVDCGSLDCTSQAARALRILGEHRSPLETFVLSHFHCDHYNGLARFHQDHPDLRVPFRQVYYPAMPRLTVSGDETLDCRRRWGRTLDQEFAFCLLAFNSFVLGTGAWRSESDTQVSPMPLDLSRLVEAISGDSVTSHAVSRGDEIPCGDGTCEVLWPPEEVSDGAVLADVRKAIGDFHQAMAVVPGLREYYVSAGLAAHPSPEVESDSDRPRDTEAIVERANKSLRQASDRLALVFRTGEQLLFMGDLQRREMRLVVSHLLDRGDTRYSILFSPHHGTRWDPALASLEITDVAVHSLGVKQRERWKSGYQSMVRNWLTVDVGSFSQWMPSNAPMPGMVRALPPFLSENLDGPHQAKAKDMIRALWLERLKYVEQVRSLLPPSHPLSASQLGTLSAELREAEWQCWPWAELDQYTDLG